jgi:hypothetical protein
VTGYEAKRKWVLVGILMVKNVPQHSTAQYSTAIIDIYIGIPDTNRFPRQQIEITIGAQKIRCTSSLRL